MTMYSIESHIPINHNSHGQYPFLKMKVGDSFTFACHEYKSVIRTADRISDETGMTFKAQEQYRFCANHYRIWRIK